MLQEAGHIKNTNVLILRYIHCLHLMYADVAWVVVSSGTQVQPQIILNPEYLPDLSVSYDHGGCKNIKPSAHTFLKVSASVNLRID